ncbi:MAG: HAMP domain-containing protein [Clostridia bacterium]|nr:HAMP domain-containing protein [Clostridia bacterium]
MLKSIRWKLVWTLALLVVIIIITIGTFLLYGISNFYHNDFQVAAKQNMSRDSAVVRQMESGIVREDAPEYIEELFLVISNRLGVDYSSRNYFLLDAKGTVLSGSDPSLFETLSKTENIIRAMNGKVGDQLRFSDRFMDFASPLMNESGEVSYILYLRDDKSELSAVLQSLFAIVWYALFISLIACILFAIFLSKTITTPISRLTVRAERLAEGEFERTEAEDSPDEIGRLSQTFDEMAEQLQSTIHQVEDEKNKMETILRHMTDGVMAFNDRGEIILLNPVAKRLLHLRDNNKLFDELFARLDVDIKLGDLLYITRENPILERDLLRGDTAMKMYFVPFKESGSKARGAVVVIHDVTEQQRLDDSRREFVANVSHELRTPLASICSYAETLLDGASEDPETANSFLQIILREGARMTRIIKDLLTLSRLDHASNAVKMEQVQLSDLAARVVENLNIEAKKRKQHLSWQPVSKLSPILGDADRLEQVLTNVVSNAIKYTQEGGDILVTAGMLYSEVYVKVKDNGVGIPEEAQKHVFDRFYRVDKARSREHGGTGLGLAIAKEIVELHGGSIRLTSKVGVGSEITIAFPIKEELR